MLRFLGILIALALAIASVQFSAADFSSDTANRSNAISSRADWTPPTATASVIVKNEGGTPGFIRQGGAYRVYANVTDTGNPASGTTTVTANVGNITTGQTAAPLQAGSYTVGGTSYNHRSAALTALSGLTADSYGYTHAFADAAANSGTQSGFNVIVDNTAPAASDVQTTNGAGGTIGKPESNDQLLLTFSEPIEPNSILAGWTGTATNVIIRIADGGLLGNDVLTIRNSTNTAQLPLGSVDLRRSDYVATTSEFGASGTPSQLTRSGIAITLLLGTPSGNTGTALGTASMVWTPSATATDRAGNPALTTAKTETGTADIDF